MFLDQECRLVCNLAEQITSLSSFQVDNRTQMQFACADMSIKDALGSNPVEHFTEVLHIGRQTTRSYCRIFYHAHGLGITLHTTKNTQPCFTKVPHFGHFRAIYARTFMYMSALKQIFFQSICLQVKLFPSISSQFRNQQCRRNRGAEL